MKSPAVAGPVSVEQSIKQAFGGIEYGIESALGSFCYGFEKADR